MSMPLSFSETFFTGEDGFYPPSKRPTNVLQAIESMPMDERIEIAREVFAHESPELFAKSEEFEREVLERIRENNTCDDYTSPVTVYIDDAGYYSVTVYE